MIGTIEQGAEPAASGDVATKPSALREPNFFVVGAARAGTTSLWEYLRQHPDVFLPESELSKEPSYFCHLTPPWVPQFATLDGYLSLFSAVRNQTAIGEASTAYLSSPESPGLIHERYPHARIVIVLRNPAERAYSHYRLLCELGFERSETFERALSVEDERYDKYERGLPLPLDPFWYCAYFYYRTGLYAEQLERYLQRFGKEQIQVVLFDDLAKRPVETTQTIFRFLGVDPSFVPATKILNKSYFPLSLRTQCLVGQRWSLHPVGPRTRRPRLRDYTVLPVAFGLNLYLGNWFRTVTFNPDTRRELLKRYEGEIARTAAIIGWNLDHWMRDRK
jgi:hypothetical protein